MSKLTQFAGVRLKLLAEVINVRRKCKFCSLTYCSFQATVVLFLFQASRLKQNMGSPQLNFQWSIVFCF